MDDPAFFARARSVGSYLGLRPRQADSGALRPQLRITKAGDEMLRGLFSRVVRHHLLGRLGPDTDLKRWGLKLAERGGKAAKKRAVVAMARKLSVLLLRLWTTGEIDERSGMPRDAASSLLNARIGPDNEEEGERAHRNPKSRRPRPESPVRGDCVLSLGPYGEWPGSDLRPITWRPSMKLQRRTWSDLSMHRTTNASTPSASGNMVTVLVRDNEAERRAMVLDSD